MLLVSGSLATAQIASQPPVPEWIHHPSGGSNQPVFFRQTFQARLPLLKAVLLAACEGRMIVYINGEAAGQITGRERAASLDVTSHIREGQNVLAIEAVNPAGLTACSIL